MKSFLAIILSSLISISTISQNKSDIVIGTIDSLQSKILNENRKIWVHIPDNDANSIYLTQNYPVIYLLDGPGHFTSVVGMMQHISNNSMSPKMIVVGIPNTNRTRDLTPSKAKPNPPMVDSTMAAVSGGGKNFQAFLEKELIPYIDANYPTSPYRMLIGHSFGGLFAVDTFLEKPELFNSYISIDPSIAWDNSKVLEKAKKHNYTSEKYKNKRLYLGIANTMDKEMDTIRVKKDTTFMTNHIRKIFDMRNELNLKAKNKFNFKSKYYGNDSHGSAPLITTYDGLRYIFDFFNYEIPFEDIMADKTDFIDELKQHYKKVSLELGYTNTPDEALLNGMGYQAMQMRQMNVSKELFKLNIYYYPESSNVYDSMGDYYLAQGDKKKAMESFEKALSLKESPASRAKLERLKNE